MDLLKFDGQDMYFDEYLPKEIKNLLELSSEQYGSNQAESMLLEARNLCPASPSVLVAQYRYYYFRHRYEEVLSVGEYAIEEMARRLGLPSDWRSYTVKQLSHPAETAMTNLRFLLTALKGTGYLLLRLDRLEEGLERLRKVESLDDKNRLGAKELADFAEEALKSRALLKRKTAMIDEDLEDDLKELTSAEEFLEHFEIPFDPSVVHVNRLHILQRFRDYLDAAEEEPETAEGWWKFYAAHLEKAYKDFLSSDALTEKVFKVLKDADRKPGFVPASDLLN